MAFSLSFCVMLLQFIDGCCGNSRGTFPLESCSGDLDILGVLEYDQLLWQEKFTFFQEFYSNLPSTSGSLVQAATVLHKYSIQPVSRNVSFWKFNPVNDDAVIIYDATTELGPSQVKDINKAIELKLELVDRVFQEVRTVRQQAIHVGIIFLDGSDLIEEEIKNVISIVQNRNTNVKILVLIYGSDLVQEVVYLTDTIVVPSVGNTRPEQILMMTVCKLCLQGWYMLEYTFGGHVRSCYRLEIQDLMVWPKAMSICNNVHGGFLAGVETDQEYRFLQDLLSQYVKEHVPFPDIPIIVYIGLLRDPRGYEKRHQWFSSSGKYCPLIIDHWLPGKPSYPYGITDCGGWLFPNNWVNGFRVVNDGWLDVPCIYKGSSVLLCEVVLPRQVENNNIITAQAASKDSFQTALVKGDFVIFRGNIVSVFENVANSELFYISQTTKEAFPVFDCAEDTGQQRYISYSLVCDRVEQCSNKRDEANCYNENRLNVSHPFCTSGMSCWDGSCSPLPPVSGRQLDCLIYKHIIHSILTNENININDMVVNRTCVMCNTDTCIDISQVADGIIVCNAITESINSTKACKNSTGDFIWAPKCVHIKDRSGDILGCRDKSHLRDCKDYLCSEGYVKCYDSYCIPQHYLLDGKADCPTGEDEQTFYIGPCAGNFACWNSKVCLHPDRVCDGHFDCPYNDDELNCNTFCPVGFRCTAGTVVVANASLSSYVNVDNLHLIDSRTRYLDMSGIDLSHVEDFLPQAAYIFPYLAVLILSKCNISNIISPDNETAIYNSTTNIGVLDVSYNRIQKIFSTDIFINAVKNIHYLNASHNKHLVSVQYLQFNLLEILDLSYTGLSHLNDSVFEWLPNLKYVNLSCTLISDFSKQYFPSVFTLQTLDLRGILIEDLTTDLFHGLKISQSLYTDQFQICCPKIRGSNIPYYFCLSPVVTISSCDNLIGLSVQRVLLWLVAVLAVLGNVTIIVYRVIWDRSVLKAGYGLFVTNLGISDFLMGVYLFTIAGADYVYRDNYVFHDKNWRKGVSCKSAGFIATLSHEASTLFTFLITLDRLLVIKYPFGQIHFSSVSKIVSVILVWILSCLLSLIPIIFNSSVYSSNAMCLGLPLTSTQVNGWEYSVGLFVIYNFILFLMIACGQLAIFRAMSQNKISSSETNMSLSLRARDITVVKQLSLVAMSNFMCWFPVGIMGLLSLGGQEISDEVYSWTTVLLLPINSAVNPVLYTIPALMDKWKKFKYGA